MESFPLVAAAAFAGLSTDIFERASNSYGGALPLGTTHDAFSYDPLSATPASADGGTGLPLLMPDDEIEGGEVGFYSYDPELSAAQLRGKSSAGAAANRPPTHHRRRPTPPPTPPPAPPPPDHSREAHFWTHGDQIRTNVLGGEGGYEGRELKIKGISWFGLESKP